MSEHRIGTGEMGIKISEPPPRPDDEIFTVHSTVDGEMQRLVTLKRNGEMVFGANYDPDEAAKIFWDAIIRVAPENIFLRESTP